MCEDGRCALAGNSLAQDLDSVQDPQPVPNTGDAHLLQGNLVQLENHIAPDVIDLERIAVSATFNVGQPSRNILVRPGA